MGTCDGLHVANSFSYGIRRWYHRARVLHAFLRSALPQHIVSDDISRVLVKKKVCSCQVLVYSRCPHVLHAPSGSLLTPSLQYHQAL
jgi:hypothetical protein